MTTNRKTLVFEGRRRIADKDNFMSRKNCFIFSVHNDNKSEVSEDNFKNY